MFRLLSKLCLELHLKSMHSQCSPIQNSLIQFRHPQQNSYPHPSTSPIVCFCLTSTCFWSCPSRRKHSSVWTSADVQPSQIFTCTVTHLFCTSHWSPIPANSNPQPHNKAQHIAVLNPKWWNQLHLNRKQQQKMSQSSVLLTTASLTHKKTKASRQNS